MMRKKLAMTLIFLNMRKTFLMGTLTKKTKKTLGICLQERMP